MLLSTRRPRMPPREEHLVDGEELPGASPKLSQINKSSRRRSQGLAKRPGSDLGPTLKPVRAPVLAPHPVVDEEEPFRVIAALDCLEPRIVGPPERLPPVVAEVIRLRHIRTRTGRNLFELACSLGNVRGIA